MAGASRKTSKSKTFWKYGSETREQRRARLNATKDHAKRRARKLLHVKPNETPELKAARAEQEKAAALKLFRKWLDSKDVTDFARENRGRYGLIFWLKDALSDILPSREGE